MTCWHIPGDSFISPLTQVGGRLEWKKTYCKKCRGLIRVDILDAQPPAQIDQPFLPDGSFDITVFRPQTVVAVPNLTGESNAPPTPEPRALPRHHDFMRLVFDRGVDAAVETAPI